MKYFQMAALSFAVVLLAASPAALKSGIDLTSFDLSCKPCDDFWRHVNGTFLDKNPIPARYPSWGVSAMVREGNKERLRVILESAAASGNARAGSNEKKIGDFYSACIDTAAIDAAGIKPIEEQLKRIAAIASIKELVATMIDLQAAGHSGSPVFVAGAGDLKNSKMVIANVAAAGLSLPDRDYYFKQDARSVETRNQFLKHVAKMSELLGGTPTASAAAAQAVLTLETAFAEAAMTNVERRDPNSRYHKMNLQALSALAPTFNWSGFFEALTVPVTADFNVSEPAAIERFEKQLKETPLADWKTWLRWRLINAAAANLAKPFAEENFHFAKTFFYSD